MRQVLIAVALFCLAGTALAEDTQRVSFKIPNGNSKYIVSQNIEIGDVPNHTFRAFDTVTTIPKGAATVAGLALTEVAGRGIGEGIDGNGGSAASYLIFTAENGDKFFSRNHIISEQVHGKLLATFVGVITSGTGRFAGIHGVVHLVNNYDPNPGGTPSNASFDIEYSLGH